MGIIYAVIGIIAGLAIGFFVGMKYRQKVAEAEIGSAEMEATRLINEAIRSGESRKKEMLLEAKDEIHRSRTEHDKEVKERRAELSKQSRSAAWNRRKPLWTARPKPSSARKRS